MTQAIERHALVGFERWNEFLTVDPAVGSFLPAYPSTELLREPLGHVARTPNLAPASTRFRLRAPEAFLVGLFGFVDHNSGLEDSFRLTLWADDACTIMRHQTGIEPFHPVNFEFGVLRFEDERFWTGRYRYRDLARKIMTRPVWLGRSYLCRAIDVEVFALNNPTKDAAKTQRFYPPSMAYDPSLPDGYWQCGLFDVSEGFQLTVNFARGSSEGFRSRTEAIEAEGGTKDFERRDKPLVFRGQVKAMPRAEYYARFHEFTERHDVDRPFLWVPYPNEPVYWPKNVFLARQTGLELASAVTPLRHAVPLNLEQVL